MSLYGSLTCRKPATWDRRLYFPSEGRHDVDFFPRKIRRLRPGLNSRSWVPEGSMLITRPPKSLRSVLVNSQRSKSVLCVCVCVLARARVRACVYARVCGVCRVCGVWWVWCGVVWCGVVWCGVVWCGMCVRDTPPTNQRYNWGRRLARSARWRPFGLRWTHRWAQ
jgi:hypothetical protein